MTRPRYEQDRDLLIERRAIDCVLEWWRVEWAKDWQAEKREGRQDFRIHCGQETVTFSECKGRTGDGERFSTWFVALGKVNDGWAVCNPKPLLLVYSWDEAVYFARVRPEHIVKIELGGNFKRDDGMGDRELMAHFPRELFTFAGTITLPGKSPPA